jgi:cell division transport system permease protein
VGEGKFAPRVTLVLRAGTGEAARSALEQGLRAEEGVLGVRFVGREAALARLAHDLGDARLLEGLGENPLPDALVVRLASDLAPRRSERLLQQWRKLREVDEVLADQEMVERLRRVSDTLRLMAQVVVLLLLMSGAVVVFNTIRLQLSGRQQEIELLRLLGAPAGFVRRPFVARGTLLAVAAAGCGWALAEALVRVTAGWLGPLAEAWGLAAPPATVPLQTGIGLLTVAVAMGWLTAWLGVADTLPPPTVADRSHRTCPVGGGGTSVAPAHPMRRPCSGALSRRVLDSQYARTGCSLLRPVMKGEPIADHHDAACADAGPERTGQFRCLRGSGEPPAHARARRGGPSRPARLPRRERPRGGSASW